MATQYVKLQLSTLLASDSDYTDLLGPLTAITDDLTSAEVLVYRVSAATAGTTLALTNWTTIQYLIVQNLDATNYCTIAFQNISASSQSQRVAAGKMLVASDVNVANATLTANSAAVDLLIVVIGS